MLIFIFGRGAPRFDVLHFIASAILAAGLLILSWVDLDRYLLPDVLTLPLIGAGLFYAVTAHGEICLAGLGALIGYGIIAGLALFWRRRFGREGIGLGDAKLLAAGGAWTGVQALPLILLIGSGTALAVMVVLAIGERSANARKVVPFGPALALGIWTVWCRFLGLSA